MTESHTHDSPRPQGPPSAPDGGRRSSIGRFVRHYIELVVAMFAGMVLLGMPAGWALTAVGNSTSELTDNAPALMLLGMAVMMTAPNVAWMRHRGHGWRANTEMAASMVLPTFAAIGLATDVVINTGTLLAGEHVVMLLGMLAAMLLRLDEYTRHHGHGGPVLQAATT